MPKKKRCPGSHGSQMLDWFPEEDGYPGACVCIHCSYGIVVLKDSVKMGVSRAGHEGLTGTLRVHYV